MKSEHSDQPNEKSISLADQLQRVTAERDALIARLKTMRKLAQHTVFMSFQWNIRDYEGPVSCSRKACREAGFDNEDEVREFLASTLTTTLGQVRAKAQAEELDRWTHGNIIMPTSLNLKMRKRAKKLRSIANGVTHA